jgi:hypothetical protein
MGDQTTTTVLYTLTTLAQSCAALAAFVGRLASFAFRCCENNAEMPSASSGPSRRS